MKIFLAIIIVLFLLMCYKFDQMHIQGKENCDKIGGVWLDKELKCLTIEQFKLKSGVK